MNKEDRIVYRKGFGKISARDEMTIIPPNLTEQMRSAQKRFFSHITSLEQFHSGKCARCGYDIDYALQNGTWLFRVQNERSVSRCPGCRIDLAFGEIIPEE